jgi:hypothetical protein
VNPSRLLPVIALLLLTLSACGGDDSGETSSTPFPDGADSADVAYFNELTAALDAIGEDSRALNDLRANAFDEALSEEERITNAEEFVAQYEAFAQSGHDELLAIEPGPSLSGQHGDLVDALGGLVPFAEDLASALEANPVSTEQAFRDLYFELEGQSLELRVRDACFDIETVAANLGIEATIACPR